MALISNIISFKDVSLSFGGVKALTNVSFDIKEGQTLSDDIQIGKRTVPALRVEE